MTTLQQNPIYKDIDLNLMPNPLTGDLTPKVNVAAIQRAIGHLFRLNPFDIPFQPKTRSNLKRYLFEGNDQVVKANLVEDLKWVCTKLEPRIEVKEITINDGDNPKTWVITVVYFIRSLSTEERFNFTVERAR
ncbi:baseplate wedge subunit [Stenotrophomonas phage vB_SmaM_Bhz51]